MFARCQDKSVPYEHAYGLSSGDFPDATFNLALLRGNSEVMCFHTLGWMGSGWYLITFSLSGQHLRAVRPTVSHQYALSCNDTTNQYPNEGWFGLYNTNGYVLQCDWIRLQKKNDSSEFSVTICAPDCLDYNFSRNDELYTYSYSGGWPTPLRTDFIYSTTSKTLWVNLTDGTYSIVLTMAEGANCENMSVFAEGKLVVNELTCEEAVFERRWFTIDVADGDGLDLVFDGDSWGVCALTIERGIRGVKVGET